QVIANATRDEYVGSHDCWTNWTRYGCNDPTLGCVDHDVDPDATFLFWFVINTPGTYFFACHQVDTTAIPWMIHQDKGMWGTIVVSGGGRKAATSVQRPYGAGTVPWAWEPRAWR